MSSVFAITSLFPNDSIIYLGWWGRGTNSSGTVQTQWFNAGSGYFGTSTSGDGGFNTPHSVWFDMSGGHLFVGDSYNDRIQRFSTPGVLSAKWGSSGTGDANMDDPYFIYTEGMNNLAFVGDFLNHRVIKCDTNGAMIEWYGRGSNTAAGTVSNGVFSAGSGVVAGAAFSNNGDGGLNNPRGIARDANGDLYIVDRSNHRIVKYSGAGVFLGWWGRGTASGWHHAGSGETPASGNTDWQFTNPSGIVIAGSNVYIADLGNHRVVRFGTNTNTSFHGFIGRGPKIGWNPGGFNYTATSGMMDSEFNQPYALAVDAWGNLFVSEFYNSRMQKLTKDGGHIATFGSVGTGDGMFSNAAGVSYDAASEVLYVADRMNNRIQAWKGDTAPRIAVSRTGFATNAGPVAVTLSVNETNGYWSTNGGTFYAFTNDTNFSFTVTTRLYYYGQDGSNNSGTNMQLYSIGALAASNTDTGATYTSVRDALSNAVNGQTIVVFEGVYNESVYFYNLTNVRLISYPWLTNGNTDAVVLDGTGLGQDPMVANGLSRNGVVFSNAMSNRLEGFSIRYFTNGIFFCDSNPLNLRCVGNVVAHNRIYSNGLFTGTGTHGITMANSWVHTNHILSNEIFRNAGHGINVGAADVNTYAWNRIYQNNGRGISLDTSATYNTIASNAIFSNAGYGINLEADGSDNCVIISNYIAANDDGIHYSDADYGQIISNIICSNRGDGIEMNNQADVWKLWDNHIYGNTNYGINLYGNGDFATVFSNRICDNGNGLRLWDADSNMIAYNEIVSNRATGLYVDPGAGNPATNNYVVNNVISYNWNNNVAISGDGADNNYFISNFISRPMAPTAANPNNISFGSGPDGNWFISNIICSNAGRPAINCWSGYPAGSWVSDTSNSTNNVFMYNAIFSNSYAITFDHDNYRSFSLISNRIFYNTTGINNSQSDYLYIFGNDICSNFGTGIYMAPPTTGPTSNVVSNSIVGNNIFSNGNYDIRLNSENADTNFISNNVIHSTRYGIYLENGPDGIEIVRNTISNCFVNGIYSSGVFDNNAGAGIVYNNFVGNLTNARVWSSAWDGTNVQSNFWGAIAIDSITNKFADTNAATNFYAPYRIGWVGIDQQDIEPPAVPTGVLKANNGVTNYIVWDAVPGAAGYRVWRANTVNEWTNFTAPYAAVTTPMYMDTAAGAGFYYYITAFDSAVPFSNESFFSAPETIANTPPLVTNLSVTPTAWLTNTPYTFSAVYFDFEGDGPSNGMQLVLSNTDSGVTATNAMFHASGTFASGATYTNRLTITTAANYVFFVYTAGSNSSVTPVVSAAVNAPRVIDRIVASNTNTGDVYGDIQSAVTAASGGETIAVFAGAYSEKVIVAGKTNLVIVGWPWVTNNDNTKAVLDGTGLAGGITHGIHVTNSEHIVLRGLSIAYYTNGIYFSADVSNCVIQSNVIYSNGIGYTAGYAGGIHLYDGSAISNAIRENIIISNGSGIVMSNSSFVAIISNYISRNVNQGVIATINYISSPIRSNNDFSYNTFCSNGNNGIFFRGTWRSNTIFRNRFFNNTGSGLYIDGFSRGDVAENEFFSNTQSGIHFQSGGAQMDASVFRQNHIYGNTEYGIAILSETADTNSIISNHIYGSRTNIYVNTADVTTIASNLIYTAVMGIGMNEGQTNLVYRNTVTNCSVYGIYLGGGGMTNTIAGWVGGEVVYNNIFLNTGSNFRIADVVNISNIARSNYWGARDVTTIAAKMDQSLAKATNFYAPYRLGMIGIDQADIEPLAPPVITNVTTNASTNIIVQWQAVGGAIGYDVYRSTADTWTNFTAAYTNLGAVTTFTDTNIVVGTRYYYFLTSIDNAAPLSNESWYSASSNGRFAPSFFADITNPAPGGLFPAVNTFSGTYGPLSGTELYFSMNGTVYGMPATNSGIWSTNINLAPYVGTTNVFYIVASNMGTGLMETNVQTNYVAPVIATNLSNGAIYISVAQAVSAASNGHTVAVLAGTANETVVISGKTNFLLTGMPWIASGNNTLAVIDGSGLTMMSNKGIDITNSTGVRIEGLTIRNFTNGLYFNVSVSNCSAVWNNVFNNGNVDTNDFSGGIVLASNTTVSNYFISNQIWSNRLGVVFLGGPKSTFIGNRVYWNKKHGVGYPDWNRPMSDSYFEGNAFYSNASAGFNGWGAQYRCIFVSNSFFSNSGGVGIATPSWDNNVFISNVILSNSGNGIEFSWGTGSNMFVYNIIEYNNSGVYFSGDYSTGDISNYFLSNSISYNRNNGVDIRHADRNFIGYNDIASNASRGIYVQAITNGITFSNEIFGNHIHGNTNEGVYLAYDKVVFTYIRSNVVSGNLHGIRIHEGDSNIIYGNVICSNRQEGIYFLPSSNNVSYNTIESNFIFGHTGGANGRGILISGDRADTNTVVSNVIFGNRIGIHITDAEEQTVMLNMLTNNSQYGLYSDGTYDGNRGAGIVAYNNFAGNPKIMRVNTGWYSTNIRSNYFGTINAGVISNSIENCAGTNFYAPYLLRPVDIFGADIIPPATRPGVTNVTTGLNGKIGVLWSIVAGASGYRVYRSEQNDEWTNLYACIADVAVTGYTDQTALPGTNYYYYVAAYDAASNETWFSDASGFMGNISASFWITLTNPAPLSWITASNYTYGGMYGVEVNTRPYYSTNGTDFQMITTTNTAGGWWLSAALPFGAGSTNITNVFYVMISNNTDRWTNLVTNYFDGSPPVTVLTNLSADSVVTNTYTFRGTVSDPQTGISNVSLWISNAAGYVTNIPTVVSNASHFYALWDSFPSSITNGAYFAYVNSINNVGVAGSSVSIRFYVSNQRASEVVESAYVFNNPYNGVGDIVFKDLPTNSTVSIYTVSGKLVTKLVMPEGDVTGMLTWTVVDSRGRFAPPGVYVCYLNSPAGIRVMKLIVKRRKQ